MYLNAATPTASKGLGAVRLRVPRVMLPNRGGRRGMGAIVNHNFFGQLIPVNTVDTELAGLEASWETARGNSTGYADAGLQLDPGLCSSRLAEMWASHCGLYPEACTGIDQGSVIGSLCSRYGGWFSSTFPKGWGDAYNYDAATFAAKFPGAVQTNVAPSWATNNVGQTQPATVPAPVAPVVTAVYRSSDPVPAPPPIVVSNAPPPASAAVLSTAAAPAGPPASAAVSSFLSSSFNVLGYQVPAVGALAAAGLAIWFMGSRK